MIDESQKGHGLLYNYTGDGKGKTTGALGTAIRAIGWGWQVAVIQFLKGERDTGERLFFKAHLPETIFESYGYGLTWKPGDHRGAAQAAWRRAEELLRAETLDLLVLDELNVALAHDFLDVAQVAAALAARRAALHVIVTGRGSPAAIRDISDLISEIADVRHPYQKGLAARQGLEY